MKNLFIHLFVGLLLASCQSPDASSDGSVPEPIIIGQTDSLRSEILDETRSIWVHVPDQASGAIFGKISYPVLYLLDGPSHFHSVTGLIDNLGDNAIVPKMVVVAISNTDRTRDLTPTHVDEMFGDSSFVMTSGGGDLFLDFMEKELIPYVERNYPVTGYRTFVGHSFGGLTSVYALLTRPELFHNYVAIDPSMWWDDWLLVKESEKLLDANLPEGRALYLGVANTMEEGMDIEGVKEDTARSSDHIRSILAFIEKVEKQDAPLEFGWKYYEDDDHGSVPLITEYDALRFLFPWYRLRGLDQFFMEEAEDDPEKLLEKLNEHYAQVSDHFGYQVPPSEADVNSLGYACMQMNKPATAKAMFELNIRNYPESANVYDSMGDFYLDQGDTLQAMEQFKRALELGDSPFTREKLSQLEQE